MPHRLLESMKRRDEVIRRRDEHPGARQAPFDHQRSQADAGRGISPDRFQDAVLRGKPRELLQDDGKEFPPGGHQDAVLPHQVRRPLDRVLEEAFSVQQGGKLLGMARRRKGPEPLPTSPGQHHNVQSVHALPHINPK